MNDEIRIRTNNVPRFIVGAYELTAKERAEFDYLDWDAIDQGNESASFIRYKGHTYDLAEFQTTGYLPNFNPLRKWEGYLSDSFFSGIVVKYVGSDYESVIVGTFFA